MLPPASLPPVQKRDAQHMLLQHKGARTDLFLAAEKLGDRFLSSAGAGGNCARPMRLPDPSPVLDKNHAPMGPEILSGTGAPVWRKAPMAFPDSSSVLDKFQAAEKWHLFGPFPKNICLVSIGVSRKYRRDTLLSWGGGIAPPLCMLSEGETLRKGGGGIATKLAMLRHQEAHSAQ